MENCDLEIWKIKFEDYLHLHPLDDASHDITHFRRVWGLAKKFSCENDDQLIILAASYFHDIVNYPKNDPRRSQSSKDAALKTLEILKAMNFPESKLKGVVHCIEAHSFSANITAKSTEAKIVQDADRMESIGAIGLARTFYVAGMMRSELFDGDDPFSSQRELDDKKYALDHFAVKLLKIQFSMNTDAGRKEAIRRAKILENYLSDLKDELFP